jgi:hypothetical protein
MAAPVVPLFPHSATGGERRRQYSSPPLSPAALSLFEQARHELAAAQAADEPAQRYASAHLAALRAAAAVVAVRAQPDRRRRQLSVWALLARVSPELREWAAFFAAGSRTRAAVQAGVTRLVSARDADDLVRQCAQFIELAEQTASDGRR